MKSCGSSIKQKSNLITRCIKNARALIQRQNKWLFHFQCQIESYQVNALKLSEREMKMSRFNALVQQAIFW